MRRITELDGLRGLGSLAIMTYHAWPTVFFFGWSRVDLFLVLSGFLITSILLKYGDSRQFFVSFYARRMMRILPVYYVGLALVLILNQLMRNPSALDGLFQHLVLIQNVEHYWGGEPAAFPWRFSHTWTIALEERFYLFWPAVLFLVGRGRAVGVCAALVVFCPLFRYLGYDRWILPGRGDSLAYGCLLAFLFARRDLIEAYRARWQWAFAGMIVLALGFLAGLGLAFEVDNGQDVVTPGWEFLTAFISGSSAVMYSGVMGLVLLNAGHRRLAPLRWGWLRKIGVISYGIYMYHTIVFWVLQATLERGSPLGYDLTMIAAMAATIGMAAVSYRYFEEPILRLKDRFPYRARPAAGATLGAAEGTPALS